MCIICVKKAGVPAPTDSVIDTMTKTNPDGFGLAIIRDGKISVYKTMYVAEYKKYCKEVSDGDVAIYHCRIATHGSKKANNCHPYLSKDGKYIFAHNGILNIPNEGDMTDSETFFRNIAEPILNAYGFKDNVLEKASKTIINTSKFVFVDNQGTIHLMGNWIYDKETSLCYSNSGYKDYYSFICDPRYWEDDDTSENTTNTDDDFLVIDMLWDEMSNSYVPSMNECKLWYEPYKDIISYKRFEQIFKDVIRDMKLYYNE